MLILKIQLEMFLFFGKDCGKFTLLRVERFKNSWVLPLPC